MTCKRRRQKYFFPVVPLRLQRVLDNLLSNAISYSPPQSRVKLGVEIRGDASHVTVSDRGPGISQAQVARVFEPFFRGESASMQADSGMGLGLAICRTIVIAHGGEIWADNRATGGAKVSLRIPRNNDRASLRNAPSSASVNPESAASAKLPPVAQ